MISVLKSMRKRAQENPDMAITKDYRFIYKSGSDVLATWKKTGWVPPSEYRTDYEFGKRKVS